MIEVSEMPKDKDFVMVWSWGGFMFSEAFNFRGGVMYRYNEEEDEMEPAEWHANVINVAKFYILV